MVAVDQVGEPRRTAGGGNDRVQMVLIHSGVDPLGARQLMVPGKGVDIFLLGKWTLCLGLQEQVLAEVGHFFRAVTLVKIDDLLQRVNRGIRPKASEIRIKISLKFVHKDQ